jgi:type IV pilus assembly protein PilB
VGKLIEAFEAVEESRKAPIVVATEEVAEDAPVVQVVTRILTQAKRDRASDVHIEPSEKIVRVRFRIDGALKEVLVLPASMGVGLVSRIKIMAGMNIVERRRSQDGQLTAEVDGKSTDVRVSTAATIWGEKCVLRILDKNRSVLRLNDLGMPQDTHSTFSKLVRAPFGMVLCAGPTGSGKTTTLYATLTEVSDATRNVMTIEDPVEYVFPSINQIQTNEQAGLTFATGLKAILRQDPDVILVGEIRDVETARIAVQSALTGHLVLSSLHATDSVSALHRFLDMGIESFLIASSVIAIVGQRLVRRICPSCKTAYSPTEDERIFYKEGGGPEKDVFYHGTGCNFCGNTGYQDRIGVYELLQMTPEIKRLIVGWATQDELRRLAQKQGMRTLSEEAISLVAQDVTTISEVIRSIYSA